MKWTLGIAYLGLGIIPSIAIATPALKLHVFEPSRVTTQQQIPTLKLHIFNQKISSPSRQVVSRSSDVHSQSASAKNDKPIQYEVADVYINTGIQREEFQWSVAGSSGSPNILSELTWDDIEIAKLQTGLAFLFDKNWLFNLDLGYGRIYEGKNQDSDYFGDNRTLEFSRSNNGADEGDVYEASVSLGYQWVSPIQKLSFVPKLGLSYRAQNLKIVDGVQTVSDFGNTTPLGPFDGLDSSFDATWFGPWIGLDTVFDVTPKFSTYVDTELHYVFYNAEAQWNLRSDFAQPLSFEQEAEGVGVILRLGGAYQIDKQLALNFHLEKTDWLADRKGQDTLYFSDGTQQTFPRLNEAERSTFLANVGFTYRFE
jgi:outer membrane protein W